MKIPLNNLYHILSYALSDFYVAKRASRAGSIADHPMDLLCRMLLDEVELLLKHGLHLAYVGATTVEGSVRGTIDFQASIKTGAIARRRLVCDFDDLGSESPLNNIIKASLEVVGRMDGISPLLKARAERLASRFPGRVARLTRSSFSVRIDRNVKRYALAIGVCRLIHDSILADSDGRIRFVDFVRDEVAMRDIFERFVRNLLRKRLPRPFAVGRRRFPFASLHGDSSGVPLVPTMMTDAVVTNPGAALIIEVKFVSGATEFYRQVERFRSAHLYQLLSYLGSYPADGNRVAGLLVYPAVDRGLSAQVSLAGLPISVEELQLGKDWFHIEEQLLSAVLKSIDGIAPPLHGEAA